MKKDNKRKKRMAHTHTHTHTHWFTQSQSLTETVSDWMSEWVNQSNSQTVLWVAESVKQWKSVVNDPVTESVNQSVSVSESAVSEWISDILSPWVWVSGHSLSHSDDTHTHSQPFTRSSLSQSADTQTPVHHTVGETHTHSVTPLPSPDCQSNSTGVHRLSDTQCQSVNQWETHWAVDPWVSQQTDSDFFSRQSVNDTQTHS